VVPWLTSLVYRVAGHREAAAIGLQCFLGALIPVLTAAFASIAFGGSVARFAGWLAALSPLLVLYSGRLTTETTLGLVLLLALGLTAAWIKSPRPGRALGAGIAWGVAALVSETAFLMPALVLLWAWIPLGLIVTRRDRARQASLLLLGVAIAFAPWLLRNAVAFRTAVPITTSAGWALLDGNQAAVWDAAAARGGCIRWWDHEPWASHRRSLPEPAANLNAGREALEYVARYPDRWPRVAAAKLARFWSILGEPVAGTDSPRSTPPLLSRGHAALLSIWSLLCLPLALWGLMRTLSGARRWFQSLAFLVVLYFTACSVVFYGTLRARLPIEPLTALFAAVGIADIQRMARSRGRAFTVIEGGRDEPQRSTGTRRS
jgi:4-amino-4-deoxy-L-arabinose transferase-like glycosyltransferase